MSWRYELKLVSPQSHYSRIKVLLQQNCEGFRTHHPARQVNSLYFDTPNLGCYEDNLLGSEHRHKLRLRWYGQSHLRITAQLELKRKRNMLGDKKVRYLPNPVQLNQSWAKLRREVKQQVAADWHELIDEASQLTTITVYWREYFVSADGQIRVTLDYKQRAYDQRGYLKPNLQHRSILPDLLTVEIKAAPAFTERLEALTASLPLQRVRFSKYVNSIKAASHTL